MHVQGLQLMVSLISGHSQQLWMFSVSQPVLSRVLACLDILKGGRKFDVTHVAIAMAFVDKYVSQHNAKPNSRL